MEKTDGPLLERFFRQIPSEDLQFLKDDVTDPAVIARWVENLDLERVFPLLALVDGEVVGDATLHRSLVGWSRHVAEVRVVVALAFRRKGVAEVLVRELVSLAADSGIDILEAHILQGQLVAQQTLEAFGFEVETVLRNRATDRTGRRRNVQVMTNDVAELWRRMEDLLADYDTPQSGMY
jgi:RimJ/RimL family protein N-acetyltransferase